jgi:hypothetical protein
MTWRSGDASPFSERGFWHAQAIVILLIGSSGLVLLAIQ